MKTNRFPPMTSLAVRSEPWEESECHCHFHGVTSIPLKGVAVHGDHVIADAAMNRPGSGFRPCCPEGGEQRQQVLVVGMGQQRIRVLLPVVQQGLYLPSAQLLGQPA